jgi:hypothetical protein
MLEMDFAGFCFNQHLYMLHKISKCTREVTKEEWAITFQDVKS